MDLRPGDTVFGESQSETYDLVRFIDSGSFGQVFEIRNQKGHRFALKTIMTGALDTTELDALLNEGAMLSSIKHENVLRVFYFHDGKQHQELPPYMLVEYADGGTLEDYLNLLEKPLAPMEMRSLFLHLSAGMKSVNAIVVHRDIKPDNILMVEGVPKISDFGLAKIVGAMTRSRTFKGINHIRYCAPEAWRTEKNLPSMDLYSMGIVFYRIATLRFPYTVNTGGDEIEAWRNAHLFQVPEDPRTYNSELNMGTTQLILKMLSKRPEDRPNTWDEVIEKLDTGDLFQNSQPDVSNLVEVALQGHRKAELAQYEKDQQRRATEEHEGLVKFSFDNEIVKAAQDLVDHFNSKSEFAKLAMHHIPPLTFSIMRVGGGDRSVMVSVEYVYKAEKFQNKTIKAWGSIKAPSGKGYNLLLLQSDADDMYGTWWLFWGENNPGLSRENRPQPIVFGLNELPREFEVMGALHVYKFHYGEFDPKCFDPAIMELVNPPESAKEERGRSPRL